MSAFNDIWINGKEQVTAAVRDGLSDWVPVVSGVWLSHSNNGKFFLQYEDGEYHMVLLGQLYEELSAEEVLKRCVSYIDGNESFEDPAGHYIIFLRNSSANFLKQYFKYKFRIKLTKLILIIKMNFILSLVS